MDPISITLLIVGAAATATLITYFITSNGARRNAAIFREKIARVVELLRKRIRELEEMARKVDEWRSRAQQSESNTNLLEQEITKLRAKVREYEGKLAQYQVEAGLAASLVDHAVRYAAVGGVSLVTEGLSILMKSRILRKAKGRGSKALQLVDEEYARIDAESNELLGHASELLPKE